MAGNDKKFNVAVIAGDGIGPEVINEAKKVVEVAVGDGVSFNWNDYPFGAAHYKRTGEVMSESSIKELGRQDVLLLGAIGDPSVKPGILERGILLRLRFEFDQYVNLRPALSFPNVPTPVPLNGRRMDSVVVRENTEDLYMGLGDISEEGAMSIKLELERGGYSMKGALEIDLNPGFPFAAQVAMNTEHGVARIARYACETAMRRGEKRVTIVTKSNAAPALYGFFEDRARSVIATEYPEINVDLANVDAICYHLVRKPTAYGVLLCPNLFGDIVSDLQAGLAGGLGTAAGGNIGDGLSMFEPVHGSAPDIAGTGKANPVAAILSGALMLRHLKLESEAESIEAAVYDYLERAERKDLPYEFSGEAACSKVGDLVLKYLK